jgi:hypothetical protein
MTCEECLNELATGSLRDLTADSPVMTHCARCPDCAQVTTQLREREYHAATALNTLPPLASPLSVAESAATISHRRRVGHVVVMLSGIVGGIIIWIVSATMIVPAMYRVGMIGPSPGLLRTETFTLSCLSPQQAGDIISPYVHSHGSTYYTPSSGIGAITVRGTPEEVAKAQSLLAKFENDPNAACHHTMATEVRKLQQQLSEIDQGIQGPAKPPPGGVSGGVPASPKK